MADRSKIILVDSYIDGTDGIGILATGEVEIELLRSRVTRSREANILIDTAAVQIERIRSAEIARAFAAAVEGGATADDLRAEYAGELKARGIDFDLALARCGNVAQVASFIMQALGG